MKQIYHHFELWEDYHFDFYSNCSGKIKEQKADSVLTFFNDEKLVHKYMDKVIREWKYSCEHNLSNPSMNRVAYLGQAACALYDNIPNSVTMYAWNLLDKVVRDRADSIANIYIEKWNNNNKNTSQCLSIF